MSSQCSSLLRHDVVPEWGCCPGGGLCCPDDPLHLVLHFFPATDAADVSLAALGVGTPPRGSSGSVQDNGDAGASWVLGPAGTAPGGGGGVVRERDSFGLPSPRAPLGAEPVDVISVLFADYATDPRSCAAAGATPAPVAAAGGVVHACAAAWWGGVASSAAPPPCPAPPKPAAGSHRTCACRALDGARGFPHDAPPPVPTPVPPGGGLYARGASPLPALSVSATQSPASRTSSSGGLQTISETGLPPPRPVPRPQPCVVPRKRRRPPAVKKLRPWSLDFPLHALPPAAAPAPAPDNNPGGDGVRRRRVVARRRNRQTQRVCSHCGTPKTPQWRAGPEGPGTLCNACGIRFVQGPEKLKREYRPRNAPGFRSDQHSNRDKKVRALSEKNERERERAMDDDML
ncbi:hypothetical protein BS78_05G085500 [Paspalum vaginatum]|nr:hypothetical protein BS78_05G085500 [Paspalum vaginatum]